MAKVTRKKAARGIELAPGHVFDVLDAVAAEVVSSSVDAGQLSRSRGVFPLSLTLPYIGTDLRSSSSESGRVWGMPFMLPPLQSDFSVTSDARGTYPNVTALIPRVMLEEVHFSIDTRGEEGSIVSHFWKSPTTSAIAVDRGKLSMIETDVDVTIAIYEKDPTFFTTSTAVGTLLTRRDVEYTREVWSAFLPAAAFFLGGFNNNNPYVVSDVNVAIDRWKSYCVVIRVSGLGGAGDDNDLVLVSPNIDLIFSHPLVGRAVGATANNLPSSHLGAKAAPSTPVISRPAPEAAIEADTADGVQTNMDAVDAVFRRKMRGGYNEFSEVPPEEELSSDACYSVIAVPLFQNAKHGGIGQATITEEPYIISAPPILDDLLDRRIIRVRFPFTIHHVLVAWNWQQFSTTGRGPASPLNTAGADGLFPPSQDLRAQVGVGVGTGLRADHFDYAPIASVDLLSPLSGGWGQRVDAGALPVSGPGSSVVPYDFELLSVPITHGGGTGVGFDGSQGEPVFVGRSLSRTMIRQGGLLSGEEQWIEVRCKISDGSGVPIGLDNYDADSVFVGYQGLMVYLICETYLV